MDYPLEMRTERALGILGRLIFDWAEAPDDGAPLPPGSVVEAGRVVVPVATFHRLMAAEGLVQGDPGGAGGDYAVRADVTEVELIRRSPGRASLLLPEPDIVRGCRAMAAPVAVPVVRLYQRMAEAHDAAGPARLPPARHSAEEAIYGTVALEGDVLEAFIYPNTAYYSCTQCL